MLASLPLEVGGPAGIDAGKDAAGLTPLADDAVAPVVASIVRAEANPTSGASAEFTVTFSEDVTGVDTSDFVLTTVGVSGPSVAGS